MGWHEWSTFVGLCGLTLGACAPRRGLPQVETKVFLLTPQEYENKSVQVSGRVTHVGDASAFFYLEDETGRIVVSTAAFQGPFSCSPGDKVRVLGSWQIKPAGGLEPSFFLAQDVSCSGSFQAKP